MRHNYITGIQQIGIGVTDATGAARTYRDLFGMNALVFDDTSEAALMTRYTGGNTFRRRAMLTLNMQGGGGFEIWQFLNRTPVSHSTAPTYGALGIFAAILKCTDIEKAHQFLSAISAIRVSPVQTAAHGNSQFWVHDSAGNAFLVVPHSEYFTATQSHIGGVLGAVIGVSDIDAALNFYSTVLGIDNVVSDVSGAFSDNPETVPQRCRRVLLHKPAAASGAFAKLLGAVQLELVQSLDKHNVPHLYTGRYWGDPGFIHLCFDVLNMDGLKNAATAAGYAFTVDSNESFSMESAAGRFCYVEDPDGTLIELVETHKVPVLKKLGLYFNLQKRGLHRPLPDWMVRLLGMTKVK